MRSQVFVLSTHFEGLPLALIEGMAAGCAVSARALPEWRS
jgi:glycosyltransferase involved in cell wall biosynthesis